MIAIISDEALYLIRMDPDKFIKLALEKDLDFSEIRAHGICCPKQDVANNAKFFRDEIEEIEIGFCAVGDNKYVMKSIKNAEDIKYFVGPDGELYTCEDAYKYKMEQKVKVDKNEPTKINEETVKKGDILPKISEDDKLPVLDIQPVASSEEAAPVLDIQPVASSEETAPVLDIQPVASSEETAPVLDTQSVAGAEEAILDDNIKQTKPKIEITEDIRDRSLILDKVLRSLPHIRNYIPEALLGAVRRFIDKNKKSLRESVTQSFLEEAAVSKFINSSDTNGVVIQNSLGESIDLLDSLINFPVFSRVIAKKNLSSKISAQQLYGAKYIRVCPIAIDENNQLMGIIDIIEIKPIDIDNIDKKLKQRLKSEGKELKKMTSSEKYLEWELEIAKYFGKDKSIIRSKSAKIENIELQLEALSQEKYQFTDIYNEENQTAWETYETASFDNRLLERSLPVEISKQLEGIAIVSKAEDIPSVDEEQIDLSDNMQRIIAETVQQFQTEQVSDETKIPGGVIYLPEKSDTTLAAENEIKISDILAHELSKKITADRITVNSYAIDGTIISPESIEKLKQHASRNSREGSPLIITITNEQANTIFSGGRAVLSSEQARPLLENIEGAVTIGGIDPLCPTNEDKIVIKK